jgi:hypothetical protein
VVSKDLNCPSSDSEATQKLSLVYEGGYSDIATTSNTVGLGVAGGRLGIGAGKTRTTGVSQTAASQKAAPPAKKAYVRPLLWIFGGYILASLFFPKLNAILPYVWIAGSVAWVVQAYRYNSGVWPNLKGIWDRSFVCNRCSHTFEA